MDKPKLDIAKQVEYLESLGIRFEIFQKSQAIAFLKNNNYFFKIKSYAKNYDKHNGVYKSVDFAYLVEISTLDMYLRRFILNLSLDIEHLLKVSLNTHFCANECENGYDIVTDFLRANQYIQDEIDKKAKTVSFVNKLTQKYQNNLALWNLVEILSFGDFLKFYKFYFDKYGNGEYKKIYSLAYCVRILRNASAHNNCILNTLKRPYNDRFKPNKHLQTSLAKMPKSTRQKINTNPALHDFIALIMLFNRLCASVRMKRARQKDCLILLKRFKKNRHYFSDNNFIASQFVAFAKMNIYILFKSSINKKIR